MDGKTLEESMLERIEREGEDDGGCDNADDQDW
jgi:hypothetical protein